MPLLRPRGRRALLAAAACILLSCLAGPGALAQAYPGKALRFIAPSLPAAPRTCCAA
jgi:hypothetical protein